MEINVKLKKRAANSNPPHNHHSPFSDPIMFQWRYQSFNWWWINQVRINDDNLCLLVLPKKEQQGLCEDLRYSEHCQPWWWGTKNWRNDPEILKHIVDTHLVSPQSSWHSNQALYHRNQCWTPAWRCCLCLLCRQARWCRSSSPSRLSRPRPWLSGGRSDRWTHLECQIQWIAKKGSVPPPLVSSRFSWGCEDSC